MPWTTDIYLDDVNDLRDLDRDLPDVCTTFNVR